MSQAIIKLVNKINNQIVKYQPSESASRKLSQNVRDSIRTKESYSMTNNYSASTFTGLVSISPLTLFTLPGFIGVFLSFVFFSSILFSFDLVHATDSSITVTISDPTVDLNVSPSTQGTFAKSAVTNIGVATTNYTGYTLKLSAGNGSNPTALVNGSDSTNTLSSITSSITEEQFKALNGTSYNNMWGYLPSKYCVSSSNNNNGNNNLNCSTNTNFLPSPTTTGDTLDITSVANSTANEYELTIGARVDTSMKLGAYTNVFLVEAVANAVPYSFIYNDNVVSNVPTDINSTTMNSSENISSNVPVRTGYTFLGWCLGTASASNITTTNGIDTCSSTVYAAGASIAIDQTGSNNDKYFYAMWSKNKSIEDLAYMQDFNTLSNTDKTSVLNLMQEGKSYYLMDNRDREVYMLAKLKDGRVWMLDNLRLGGAEAMTITNTDSNINGSTYTLPASIGTGFSSWTEAKINADYKTNVITYYGQGSGKIGVYYNYCAASAGTYCYASGSGSGDAQYDVCPAGWRMPTGGPSGEPQTLYSWYSTTQDAANINSFQYNLSMALSGGRSNNSAYSQGEFGRFWSSTHSDSSIMYTSNITSSSVATYSGNNRVLGYSIRCILK